MDSIVFMAEPRLLLRGKTANPDLMVWQITGDGDALAIGGNHFIHLVRRNIDINVVLFNNEIYGLTKGQYSPTSHKGIVTKTSPFGTIEEPFKVAELVIGANGRFFARTVDYNLTLSTEVYKEAARSKETSQLLKYYRTVSFLMMGFMITSLTKRPEMTGL